MGAADAALARRPHAALVLGCGALLLTATLVSAGSLAAASEDLALVAAAATCGLWAVVVIVRPHRRPMVLVSILLADVAIGASAAVLRNTSGGAIYLTLLLAPTMCAALCLSRPFLAVQTAAVAATVAVVSAPAGAVAVVVNTVILTAALAGTAYVVLRTREGLSEARDEGRRRISTDPLTGLDSRRGLDERIPAMWHAATRRREAITVLMMDVDQLDSINDADGHAAGDALLVALAGVVRTLVRTEDLVARLEGGELAVVTADASSAGPADIGERLRRAVASASLSHQVTVSVGAVRYVPSDLDDPLPTFAGLLDDADQAMRSAQQAGANRVVGLTAPPFIIPPPRSAAH